MKINKNGIVLWCPQHEVLPEQEAELKSKGIHTIVYLKDIEPELYKILQNTGTDVYRLAQTLKRKFQDYEKIVLPIGSPGFVYVLGSIQCGYKEQILFAHSERQSVEEVQPDGSVKKYSIFRHIKFFNPFGYNLRNIKKEVIMNKDQSYDLGYYLACKSEGCQQALKYLKDDSFLSVRACDIDPEYYEAGFNAGLKQSRYLMQKQNSLSNSVSLILTRRLRWNR